MDKSRMNTGPGRKCRPPRTPASRFSREKKFLNRVGENCGAGCSERLACRDR